MAEPFLGELKLVPYSFAPRYWAFCNGLTVAIAQNQALFSLLGTTYGGNGVQTFQLPNLQGQTPMHYSATNPIGAASGAAAVALTPAQVPVHTHQMMGTKTVGTLPTVAAGQWLGAFDTGYGPYAAATTTTLEPSTIAPNGANAPHENRQPWLCLNYIIALAGVFPSRN